MRRGLLLGSSALVILSAMSSEAMATGSCGVVYTAPGVPYANFDDSTPDGGTCDIGPTAAASTPNTPTFSQQAVTITNAASLTAANLLAGSYVAPLLSAQSTTPAEHYEFHNGNYLDTLNILAGAGIVNGLATASNVYGNAIVTYGGGTSAPGLFGWISTLNNAGVIAATGTASGSVIDINQNQPLIINNSGVVLNSRSSGDVISFGGNDSTTYQTISSGKLTLNNIGASAQSPALVYNKSTTFSDSGVTAMRTTANVLVQNQNAAIVAPHAIYVTTNGGTVEIDNGASDNVSPGVIAGTQNFGAVHVGGSPVSATAVDASVANSLIVNNYAGSVIAAAAGSYSFGIDLRGQLSAAPNYANAIYNGGTITGGGNGAAPSINLVGNANGGSGVKVTNSGILNGDVVLANAADQMLLTGGTVNGNIYGVANAAGQAAVWVLADTQVNGWISSSGMINTASITGTPLPLNTVSLKPARVSTIASLTLNNMATLTLGASAANTAAGATDAAGNPVSNIYANSIVTTKDSTGTITLLQGSNFLFPIGAPTLSLNAINVNGGTTTLDTPDTGYYVATTTVAKGATLAALSSNWQQMYGELVVNGTLDLTKVPELQLYAGAINTFGDLTVASGGILKTAITGVGTATGALGAANAIGHVAAAGVVTIGAGTTINVDTSALKSSIPNGARYVVARGGVGTQALIQGTVTVNATGTAATNVTWKVLHGDDASLGLGPTAANLVVLQAITDAVTLPNPVLPNLTSAAAVLNADGLVTDIMVFSNGGVFDSESSAAITPDFSVTATAPPAGGQAPVATVASATLLASEAAIDVKLSGSLPVASVGTITVSYSDTATPLTYNGGTLFSSNSSSFVSGALTLTATLPKTAGPNSTTGLYSQTVSGSLAADGKGTPDAGALIRADLAYVDPGLAITGITASFSTPKGNYAGVAVALDSVFATSSALLNTLITDQTAGVTSISAYLNLTLANGGVAAVLADQAGGDLSYPVSLTLSPNGLLPGVAISGGTVTGTISLQNTTPTLRVVDTAYTTTDINGNFRFALGADKVPAGAFILVSMQDAATAGSTTPFKLLTYADSTLGNALAFQPDMTTGAAAVPGSSGTGANGKTTLTLRSDLIGMTHLSAAAPQSGNTAWQLVGLPGNVARSTTVKSSSFQVDQLLTSINPRDGTPVAYWNTVAAARADGRGPEAFTLVASGARADFAINGGQTNIANIKDQWDSGYALAFNANGAIPAAGGSNCTPSGANKCDPVIFYPLSATASFTKTLGTGWTLMTYQGPTGGSPGSLGTAGVSGATSTVQMVIKADDYTPAQTWIIGSSSNSLTSLTNGQAYFVYLNGQMSGFAFE